MKKQILLTPDWITFIIENKKIEIEEEIKSITSYPTVHNIIIPVIVPAEDLLKLDYRNYQGNALWKMDYLAIYLEQYGDINLSLKGGYFLKEDAMERASKLIQELDKYKIRYSISRMDYQATFKTEYPKLMFKEFIKTETKLKKFIVEANDRVETVSFGNSVFKVQLYLKSLQVEQVKKKSFKSYKEAFLKKYGEISKDILRMEYSLTSKSSFLKKMKIEIIQTKRIRDITFEEINNSSKKYKLTKNYKSKIKKSDRL